LAPGYFDAFTGLGLGDCLPARFHIIVFNPSASLFSKHKQSSTSQKQKSKKKSGNRSRKFHLPSSDEEDEEDNGSDHGMQSGEGEPGLPENDYDVESCGEAIPQPKTRERIKVPRRQGFASRACDF